jgi:heat-inducible transcriptional repressor
MGAEALSREEIEAIRNSVFRISIGEIDRVIKETSRMLSILTNYIALVMPPQARKSTVKHIQLVQLDSSNIMAIVVTSFGIVKNAAIILAHPITAERLTVINSILNDRLRGLTIEEINLGIISEVQKNVKGYDEILNIIIPVLYESLNCEGGSEVYLEGSSNIFNYPEYNAIDKAKSFFTLLDKKDFLYKLLSSNDESTRISIGHENDYDEINDCSVITTTYKIGDNVVGSIGIIGPTRMYYSKVLSIMRCFKAYLSETLTDHYADR